MTKPGGWKHSPEVRAQISAKRSAAVSDPAVRAKISEDTKARMTDPAVRQRIKDGMRKASGHVDELRVLRAIWAATRPAVRAQFIFELVSSAPVGQAHGGAGNG